jgi:hypothetical protein
VSSPWADTPATNGVNLAPAANRAPGAGGQAPKQPRNNAETVTTYDFAGESAPPTTEGVSAMTDYLIAAVLFVAMVTTLLYLWKREHS